MCGYAMRVQAMKAAKLRAALEEWDIENIPDGRFFPRTTMTGLIIHDGERPRTIDAMWWFLLQEKEGALKPNPSITCFNARNLSGQLWRGPMKTHRCILPATSIVETLGSKSYLMDAAEGLFIGGLYRTWKLDDQVVHSCALITCEPHERFSTYHDKSIPLFLPYDMSILNAWLDPTFTDVGFFQGLIDKVLIPTDLMVTPVKNAHTLKVLGETVRLEKD